ncbi:hypothetical protein DSO57_1023046 [Entomophthora muscae]|uniref:Uncharacterized protein n=1 Tax=Entomophthora muscae TaxID=34485 RepID=A0ACC2RHL1_9FUNG|nr:hypothetical protein DSO57_1023046 [Entomophthora muscae]
MKLYSILVLASNVASSLEQANLHQINSLQELDSALGIDGVADFVAKTLPQEINWKSDSPAPVSRDSPGLQRQVPSTENPGGYDQKHNTPGSSYSPELQPQASSTESSPSSDIGNYPNEPSQTPTQAYPNVPTGTELGYSPTAIPSPNNQKNTTNNDQAANGECKLMETNSKRAFETTLNNDYPSFKGQCTEWADGRYYQLTGHHVDFLNGFYDARFWPQKASEKGWQVGSTPLVASIIALQPQQGEIGETGHVAIVESINGDSICTSNWNMPTQGVLTMKTFDLKTLRSSVKYLTHPSASNSTAAGNKQPGDGSY